MKKIIFCAFLLFSQNFLSFGQVKTTSKVTFRSDKKPSLKSPNMRLFLAGDFNNWNPADTAWQLREAHDGSYQLLKNLPGGIYHYKITRGSWQTVECTADGKPIDNRSATIARDTTITMDVANWQDSFAAAEKKHTASSQVHIVSEKFDMPQLGRQRRIWIYLPADYESSNKKYPVIYMHDGQNLFDAYTAGFGEWGIDEILDKLPAAKASIIIGIDNGAQHRITEYDPYDSKYGKGEGDSYTSFLVQTLKPYIDAHYRTKSDVMNTTIAGSSMGGLISMYAALKYPGVFGNAGVFSPSFWIAPEIYKLAEQQKIPAYCRFYFVCGDAESDGEVAEMQKMADILHAKGKTEKDTPVITIKGAAHNEKQWNGDFPAFYEWLVSPEVGKSGSPKD